MNPRQRRGILLMALAAIGAVAVFFLVLNYVQGVGSQVGPMTTAYRFTKPVKQLDLITSDVLEQVQVPIRWLPDAAIQSFDTSRGLVAAQPVAAGSLLQKGMAQSPPELKPGQREIAIMINAETGVAGKVEPNDLVDIYATFVDSRNGANGDFRSGVIVANAKVLAIGQLQQVDAPQKDKNGTTQFQQNQVVPVTFAVGLKDSLLIGAAADLATSVRLVLIPPGTTSNADPAKDLVRLQDFFEPPAPPAPKPRQ